MIVVVIVVKRHSERLTIQLDVSRTAPHFEEISDCKNHSDRPYFILFSVLLLVSDWCVLYLS